MTNGLKQTQKITLCGITAALSAVFMLLSYFPYLTYAVPALSGLFLVMPVVEIDRKWAFGSFLAASVAVFLFAETESKLFYLCFLGYYPIVKSLLEQLRSQALQWVLKLLVFNFAVVAVTLALIFVFGVSPEEFGVWGQYGKWLLLLLGNITFVVYDIALSRMIGLYMFRVHPRISNYMQRG